MTTCTYKMVTTAGNTVVRAERDLFNYAWGKYGKPMFFLTQFFFNYIFCQWIKKKSFLTESDLYFIEIGTDEEIQIHGVVKWG